MSNSFTIYPAIDLRQGKVVRLKYGDPKRQTVFADDPVAVGRQWVAKGASWLHVVNLDGAFDEAGATNWQCLPQLSQLGAKVQFGGGMRTLADIEHALQKGAARVVLGTAAVENPQMVARAVAMFGSERIAVGLDAFNGRIKTHGWQVETAVLATSLGLEMKQLGVQTVIHTDIGRDGVLTGVNVQASVALAQATGLKVIASGGVATSGDVVRVRAQTAAGLTGVVIGRALYEGKVNLTELIMRTQRLKC